MIYLPETFINIMLSIVSISSSCIPQALPSTSVPPRHPFYHQPGQQNFLMHHTRFHFLLMLLFVGAHGLRFDEVPSIASRPVQDRQLQEYIRTSCRWLQYRSVHSQYPLLNAYAEQLQLVLRTECAHCVDYYEAAGLLGLLGKTVSQIMKEARDDVHYPVVRRSYIAAVWLLQRSRQFVWETTHMPSTALSTMFRYVFGT